MQRFLKNSVKIFLIMFIMLSFPMTELGFATPGLVTGEQPNNAVNIGNNQLNTVLTEEEAAQQAEEQAAREKREAESARTPTFYSGGLVGGDEGNDSSRYSIKNIRDVLLPSVARYVASFLGALAVLALIWAGVLFLTAGGEEEKISKATKTAFYTLAALLLMMFGYVLVYLFLTIFTP